MSLPVRRGCSDRLRPGEYRRITKSRPVPFGFQIACAKCGTVNVVQSTELDIYGVTFLENEDRNLETLSPTPCARCAHVIEISGGFYV